MVTVYKPGALRGEEVDLTRSGEGGPLLRTFDAAWSLSGRRSLQFDGYFKAWREQVAADKAGITSQTSSSRAAIRRRIKEFRSAATDTLKFKNGRANGIFGYVFGTFAITALAAAAVTVATVAGPAVVLATAAFLVYAGVNAAVFGLVVNSAKEDAAKDAANKAGGPIVNIASGVTNALSVTRPAIPSSQPSLPPASKASSAFARVAGRIARVIPKLMASLSGKGSAPTSSL